MDNYPNTYNEYRYVDGCGRAYNYYNSYGAGYSFTELMYFKKGDDEWGEPILILGQEEINDNAFLNIYPNPASDRLYIDFYRNTKKMVSVYTINGRKMLSEKMNSNQNSLNISELYPGTYLIAVYYDKEVFKKVFVKK